MLPLSAPSFFAGGYTGTNPTSRVDIYDNSTGLWTTANLSVARRNLSATTVGTKVFFAGGVDINNNPSSVVNIYDNSTGLWTTANLAVARWDLSATAVGSKAFFAGGRDGTIFNPVVDIYDNISTGINELNKNEEITIFPNPANNHFTVSLGSTNKKVEVTIADNTGKVFYNTIATETQHIEVITQDFGAGIYIVQIQTADFIATKKTSEEK
ncbi:MAG: T9SS type A sorting domain-containing protein [Bacteroidetes bacterium]|nr:T9SS type A sorting domain-containing protein [Bacteroidota bacterium]